ncbi:hypothetical protein PIB30_084649 [Stylosanthes scabra]|uniref:Uncharacterized protein n=1 Tax=Stylosanthes scabra TaxID=79078 RepID=A0ABU6QTU4_9FABA|nr:hypothetical protein [Stylosanthes scabra]
MFSHFCSFPKVSPSALRDDPFAFVRYDRKGRMVRTQRKKYVCEEHQKEMKQMGSKAMRIKEVVEMVEHNKGRRLRKDSTNHYSGGVRVSEGYADKECAGNPGEIHRFPADDGDHKGKLGGA